jgi:hypothetical protein
MIATNHVKSRSDTLKSVNLTLKEMIGPQSDGIEETKLKVLLGLNLDDTFGEDLVKNLNNLENLISEFSTTDGMYNIGQRLNKKRKEENTPIKMNSHLDSDEEELKREHSSDSNLFKEGAGGSQGTKSAFNQVNELNSNKLPTGVNAMEYLYLQHNIAEDFNIMNMNSLTNFNNFQFGGGLHGGKMNKKNLPEGAHPFLYSNFANFNNNNFNYFNFNQPSNNFNLQNNNNQNGLGMQNQGQGQNLNNLAQNQSQNNTNSKPLLFTSVKNKKNLEKKTPTPPAKNNENKSDHMGNTKNSSFTSPNNFNTSSNSNFNTNHKHIQNQNTTSFSNVNINNFNNFTNFNNFNNFTNMNNMNNMFNSFPSQYVDKNNYNPNTSLNNNPTTNSPSNNTLLNIAKIKKEENEKINFQHNPERYLEFLIIAAESIIEKGNVNSDGFFSNSYFSRSNSLEERNLKLQSSDRLTEIQEKYKNPENFENFEKLEKNFSFCDKNFIQVQEKKERKNSLNSMSTKEKILSNNSNLNSTSDLRIGGKSLHNNNHQNSIEDSPGLTRKCDNKNCGVSGPKKSSIWIKIKNSKSKPSWLCTACHKAWKNNQFCHYCNVIYRDNSTTANYSDNKSWVECDYCEMWQHMQCEESKGYYKDLTEMVKDNNFKYMCPLCRKKTPLPDGNNSNSNLTAMSGGSKGNMDKQKRKNNLKKGSLSGRKEINFGSTSTNDFLGHKSKNENHDYNLCKQKFFICF